MTKHNTLNRQTSMLMVGYEPTISAGERSQSYAFTIFQGSTAIECRSHNLEWEKQNKFNISTNLEIQVVVIRKLVGCRGFCSPLSRPSRTKWCKKKSLEITHHIFIMNLFQLMTSRTNKCLHGDVLLSQLVVHYLFKKLPECYGILRFILMRERGGEHRVLVEKPEGKRPLGRPKRRWGIFR